MFNDVRYAAQASNPKNAPFIARAPIEFAKDVIRGNTKYGQNLRNVTWYTRAFVGSFFAGTKNPQAASKEQVAQESTVQTTSKVGEVAKAVVLTVVAPAILAGVAADAAIGWGLGQLDRGISYLRQTSNGEIAYQAASELASLPLNIIPSIDSPEKYAPLHKKIGEKASSIVKVLSKKINTLVSTGVDTAKNRVINTAKQSPLGQKIERSPVFQYLVAAQNNNPFSTNIVNTAIQQIGNNPEKAMLEAISHAQDLIVGTNPQELIETVNEISRWLEAYKNAFYALKDTRFANKEAEEKEWAEKLGDNWHSAFPSQNLDYAARKQALDAYIDQTVERLKAIALPSNMTHHKLLQDGVVDVGTEFIKHTFKPVGNDLLVKFLEILQNRTILYDILYTQLSLIYTRLGALHFNTMALPPRNNVFVVTRRDDGMEVIASCSQEATKRGVRLNMTLVDARRAYLRHHPREDIEVINASVTLKDEQILVDQIDGREIVRACSEAAKKCGVRPGMDAEFALQLFNQKNENESGLVSGVLIRKSTLGAEGFFYAYPGLEDMITNIITSVINQSPDVIYNKVINFLRPFPYAGKAITYLILFTLYTTWPMRKISMAAFRYFTGLHSSDALAREFARNILRHLNNPAFKVLIFRYIDKVLTTFEEGIKRAREGRMDPALPSEGGNLDHEAVIGNLALELVKTFVPTLMPSLQNVTKSRLIRISSKVAFWSMRKAIWISFKTMDYTINTKAGHLGIRTSIYACKVIYNSGERLFRLKFGGAVTSSIDLSKKQENILQETFKWMDVVIHSAAQNKGLLNVAHKIFSQIYKTAAEYGFTESHQEHYTRAGHSWAQFIHQTVLAVGRSAIAQKFNGEIKTVSSNYIKFKYDTENFVKNYDKLKVKLRESYNRLHLAIRLNKQTLIAKYTNQYNAVVQQFNDFANVFKIDAPFIQDLQKKVVDNENEIKTLKDNCKPFNEARGAATLFKEFIKDPKSQVTFGLVISQMDGMNTLYEKRIAELKAQIGKEKKDHGRANQACVDELDYLTQLQKDRIAAVTRINELLNGVQAPRAEWIATYDALLNVLNRADNWALISISTNNARIRELEAENAATNLKLDQFAKVRPIPNDMGEAVEAIRNWQELDIPGIVNAVHTVWKNKLHPLYVEGFSNYRYEERIKLQQQLTELDEQLVEVQVKKEEIMKNLLNNHSMLIEMMKRKLAAEEKAGFNVIPEKLPTPALTTKREKVLHYAKAVGGFMLDQITNWEEYSKFELPKDEVENCKKDIEKYMPEQFVEILKDEARIRGNMAAVEAKRIKLYGLVSNLAMYTDPVWILERTGTEIYNEVMDSVSSLVSTVENAASK